MLHISHYPIFIPSIELTCVLVYTPCFVSCLGCASPPSHLIMFPLCTARDPKPFVLDTSELRLTNLESNIVDEIFSATDINTEQVTITGCALDNVENVPYSFCLHLEDIPSHVNLVDYLRDWDGEVLFVNRCLSFDDRVLTELTAPRARSQDQGQDQNPGTANNTHFLASGISELSINDCPNISVGALMNLIYVRKEYAASRPWLDNEPPISRLFVGGQGTRFRRWHVEWFRENMEEFLYCL